MNEAPNQDWLQSIASQTSTRVFKVRETIALQGEPTDYVGYIILGKAKAISYSEDGVATWVGYFLAEEFFGHMSLLTNTPANFEISAATDMKVIIISVKTMRGLLSDDTQLSLILANDLAARLDMMTRRLVEAITLSAKGRICAELARLSNIIGIMPDKSIIRPNPIFVELAMRVSSTRETVSRTISELQKQGIITREPGALVIEKPEHLKAAIK